jgi:predicted phage terminase large subunit-like protein
MIGAGEILHAAARESLGAFARLVDPEFETPEHVRKMIAAFEAVERGDISRLIVNLPPRHGKSTLASVSFPAWAYGRNPSREIAVVSYSDELASGFSRRSRNAFEAHGDGVFGLRLAADSKAVSEWSAAGAKGRVYATGVGGVLTGRGAHFAILDDTSKDAQSDLERAKQVEWYTSVLRTRLSLKPKGAIIVASTRWHQADLTGYLLDQQKAGGEKWTLIELPMLDDLDRVLWPERFTFEEVTELRRAVGERVWNSLYMCRPSDPEGGIIRKAWLRYYRVRPSCSRVVIVVDASFKDSKTADKTCAQVWGANGPNFYLLDQRMARMNFSQALSEIRGLRSKWPQARAVYVEEKANGAAVIDQLRKSMPGVIALQPQGGKESRLQAVAPLFEAGNVHLPEPEIAPWISETVEQLLAFPNSKHDDAVDAAAYGLAQLRKSSGGYWSGIPDGPASRHGAGDGWTRPDHSSDWQRGSEWGDDWTGGSRRI